MLWLRAKLLPISGPLKGFVTSGLPSSKVEVSDSRAMTLANHVPPTGEFSLATAALECTEGRSMVQMSAVP